MRLTVHRLGYPIYLIIEYLLSGIHLLGHKYLQILCTFKEIYENTASTNIFFIIFPIMLFGSSKPLAADHELARNHMSSHFSFQKKLYNHVYYLKFIHHKDFSSPLPFRTVPKSCFNCTTLHIIVNNTLVFSSSVWQSESTAHEVICAWMGTKDNIITETLVHGNIILTCLCLQNPLCPELEYTTSSS